MTAPLTPEREAEIRALRFTTGAKAACGIFDTDVEKELYRLAATHYNAGLELLAEIDRVRESLAASEEKPPVAPRTERSYWVAIADALNAAEHAGMPIGIDLDGTVTDHNAWSVVWDRTAEEWAVAGYDEEATS